MAKASREINPYYLLECSKCKIYMVPPIYVCYNGHGLCEDCWAKSPCIICNIPIVIPSPELESIARKLPYPCRYCTPITWLSLSDKTLKQAFLVLNRNAL